MLHQLITSSVAHMESYPYTELLLDEIRLLKILRGQDGPIQCQFVVSSLSDPMPSFVAISYSWGNPAHTEEITVESTPFGVTQNVLIMLEHLRRSEEDKLVWIDAICIEQKNIDERNVQLRLMRKIYSMATSIIIWLGPEADDSALLPEFIRLAKAASDERKRKMKSFRIFDASINTLLVKPGLDRFAPGWLAIGKLLDRSWFERTWVVQELALSKDAVFQVKLFRLGDPSIP